MTDDKTPDGQAHYWAMEHYGFADHDPVASGAAAPASLTPTSPRDRPRRLLLAIVALVALVLTGGGGFAAAQAVTGPPERSALIQRDGRQPVGALDPGALAGGAGDRGPRGGDLRGGGQP